MDFLNYLVQNNLLPQDALPKVNAAVEGGKTQEQALFDMGMKTEQILEERGKFFGVPTARIEDKQIPYEILEYIPEDSARLYKIVPLSVEDGMLEIGMVDPYNIEAKDAINFIATKAGKPYKISAILESDLEKALGYYKSLSGVVQEAIRQTEEEEALERGAVMQLKKQAEEESGEPTIIEQAPAAKIVTSILQNGIEANASDIHIEPLKNMVRVRYRIDGQLTTMLSGIPLSNLSSIVAKIKTNTKTMKLDEKRKPQDGRFSVFYEKRKIDFRVSTFPSYYGEKVVMRILDQSKGVRNLDELGLSNRYLKMIRDAIDRPYGMILISGPTGSGKSTTLYSILKEIDRDGKNVLSLEDPVEYSIEGVSQSQVRADIGYTFATGLRTTLRQDPDIIMVGEIRDAETAGLAVQAALTGHLVLSTIHTNTATGIIPRLIDMNIDPYLIPAVLNLGIAQRLVRKICPGTGRELPIEGSIKDTIDKSFKDLPEEFMKEVPTAKNVLGIEPTSECPKGTRGREAVFEMYEMNRDLEKVILENPVESAVYDEVRKKGLVTMKESAIIKAMQGLIPFEEVNKL